MTGTQLRLGIFFLCSLLGTSVWAEYAGSDSCKICHSKVFKEYERSGHPYKINKVDGKPPLYPSATSPGVPHPPEGYDWNDISYVIGGFGWKARFMDQQGYILTGEGRQYNLPSQLHGKDAHWVAYGGKEVSTKPYTCGGCHTTGWVATGADGPHQDNLPGIHGTWSETGVTCEACHGPGAAHVAAPTQVKPSTKENCNSCHIRGEPTAIDASGGLIRHHEQYEDLLASPHKNLSCGTCHDPHQSSVYKLSESQNSESQNKASQNKEGQSTVSACKTCHQGVSVKLAAKKDTACETCHMPFAVKTALSAKIDYQGGSVPKGDLRTHIQRITTDPNWNMFTDDGKFVRRDEQDKAYLTLDYVCLSCHTSEGKEWAQEHAKKVH